jgi:hypothetical protein
VGVSLALFQVDHENAVVRGLPLLNHALQTGDLEPLRELILTLPFEQSKQLEDHIHARIARLRDLQAPPVVLAIEEQRLARTFPPSASEIVQAPLEQLRTWLGHWCPEPRTLDLDKLWDLLHWFCDPARRQRRSKGWYDEREGYEPSLFDHAFHGYETYPCDASGEPVIRTYGDPTASWYVPPDIVTDIARAFEAGSLGPWEEIEAELGRAPEDCRPYLWQIEDRRETVTTLLPRVRDFHVAAARRAFGVSVEFY